MSFSIRERRKTRERNDAVLRREKKSSVGDPRTYLVAMTVRPTPSISESVQNVPKRWMSMRYFPASSLSYCAILAVAPDMEEGRPLVLTSTVRSPTVRRPALTRNACTSDHHAATTIVRQSERTGKKTSVGSATKRGSK